jgi:DNA polymerase III psi subunit
MGDQLANNPEALRLFFTEEIYLVPEPVMEDVQVQKILAASGEVKMQSSAPADTAVDATEIAAAGGENKDLSIAREPAPERRKDFVFLGKNKRNILILVNDEQNEVSTEQGRELLKNIVKAINLTGADFALLNYSAYPGTTFEQLQQYFSTQVLFAFGVRSAQIGLQYEDQNSLIMHEGIKMIFSSNLDQLSADMQGKKALWACLKQMDI